MFPAAALLQHSVLKIPIPIQKFAGMTDILQSFGMMFYIVPMDQIDGQNESAPDFISKATPWFFFFIAIEMLMGIFLSQKLYSIRDTIASISLGIFQQLFGIWFKAMLIFPYMFVFENLRIWDFRDRQCIYWVCFLGCDLGYYLFHRASHEWHAIWMTHSVHHSGERYNFATALRQGALQPFFSWAFYLPLAFMGIAPSIFLAHSQLNTLYQFWIHTELIERLPWPLEGILNTPSHHRMHHQPPGNCNYAGVLIIWDRLFGTFVDEGNARVRGMYGLAKPAESFDPLLLNMQHATRMTNIGPSHKALEEKDGSSSANRWSFNRMLRLLLAKRVNHKWCFNAMETLKGIVCGDQMTPTLGMRVPRVFQVRSKDVCAKEAQFVQRRAEMEGALAQTPANGVLTACVVGLFTLTLSVSYVCLALREHLNSFVCAPGSAWLRLVSSVGSVGTVWAGRGDARAEWGAMEGGRIWSVCAETGLAVVCVACCASLSGVAWALTLLAQRHGPTHMSNE